MDLFAKARLKIAFLYFVLGAVILGIAGSLIYIDRMVIIRNVLQTVQALLLERVTIDQGVIANVITQSIDAQARRLDLAVGIWLIVSTVIFAYWLAGFILRPVKRDMERQKRFMATISHELRTPLAVMKTNAEVAMLGTGRASNPELASMVENNLEEIERMSEMIDFLLHLSNVARRFKKPLFSSVDVGVVARRATDSMAVLAGRKGIAITFMGGSHTVVKGNSTAIEEIVFNLLKNAIAYSPAGSAVEVIVAKRYGAVILTVADAGPGIPSKDIPNVFEAFYRGGNAAHEKKDESVGLGLAIVKEIAILHRATVSLESEVGKGTSITVHFPSRFSRWFALPSPWA
jgi:signal transduction histidine kinase